MKNSCYDPTFQHPYSIGDLVAYCPWPYEWTNVGDHCLEAVVVSAWFDNDYPVVSLETNPDPTITPDAWRAMAIKIDRIRLITVVERLAKLDA